MADISPSQASDSSNNNTTLSSPPLDLFARAPIKRARPQLSCTPCRQGKLKCNREHPVCDQCAKRARHEACIYIPPPAKNKQAQNMRGRIRNLESLVVNLINQKAQEQGPAEQNGGDPHAPAEPKDASRPEVEVDEDPNADSFGKLRISNAGTEKLGISYVGAGHWSAILQEIEEVKDSLGDDEVADGLDDMEEWNHFNSRSTVTFGVPRPLSKRDLIQEMPPKSEVDRLLPLWFNSSDPLLYVIHAPTFQEEYKQFWRDPTATSVMWIAMLYSIMALGIIVGPRNPGMNGHAVTYDTSGSLFDRNDHMARAVDRFQQMASSAIVLADVAKSQPYTLETLMIYGECEFLRRDDHHSKIWLMNGVTLRVAMRMGYHRDPSNFPEMSPFHGEMRRRLWHVLNMMDTLISFAIGLPTLLRRIESDVRAPRNLYDHDLSPNATELPKGRPQHEITPATYTISKSRLCVVFAEAAELSQRITPPKHSQVMSLDKRLEEAHNLIPEGMRVRPLEDCVTDSPVLVMSRFNVEILYLKTKIVIHRNFFTAGQSGGRFAGSHKLCLDAALSILRYQNIIFHACQPGGQLAKVWWYMSSLVTYDFLLAAMILCLEVNHLQTADPSSARYSEWLSILENTYGIWANHPNRFRESYKGAEIVKAMLDKCSNRSGSDSIEQDVFAIGTPQPTTKAPNEMTPESTHEELPPQIWGAWPSMDEGQALDVPDVPSEIDWSLWDSTMQRQQNIIPQQVRTSSDMLAVDPFSRASPWTSVPVTENVSLVHGVHDFSNPLNVQNAMYYAPPVNDMDFTL
ncbi:hypothetical protein K491DRAFT_632576 [Lophiostoma macrostomum CBS 122681]|uniref:Zn(2)-C6 fungal-type domain-containing protein n=1 Tax=Lophiostoma macrostomum CBS 122681 TaxID=1314788 RepID=A0A6A6T4R2_9PLEO|nr:hypothetical protein K491DRAFT_632576 [Lophiostoma macrostomum CBS 122681]